MTAHCPQGPNETRIVNVNSLFYLMACSTLLAMQCFPHSPLPKISHKPLYLELKINFLAFISEIRTDIFLSIASGLIISTKKL